MNPWSLHWKNSSTVFSNPVIMQTEPHGALLFPALCKGGSALGCHPVPAQLLPMAQRGETTEHSSMCSYHCALQYSHQCTCYICFAAAEMIHLKKKKNYLFLCSCITGTSRSSFSSQVSLLILANTLKKIYVLRCSVLSINIKKLENCIAESTPLNVSVRLDGEV